MDDKTVDVTLPLSGPTESMPEADAAKKAAEEEASAAKDIADMEAGIRDRLTKLAETEAAAFADLHKAYMEMGVHVHAHPQYKWLGDKIATVEALLNTLMTTAAAFPAAPTEVTPTEAEASTVFPDSHKETLV